MHLFLVSTCFFRHISGFHITPPQGDNKAVIKWLLCLLWMSSSFSGKHWWVIPSCYHYTNLAFNSPAAFLQHSLRINPHILPSVTQTSLPMLYIMSPLTFKRFTSAGLSPNVTRDAQTFARDWPFLFFSFRKIDGKKTHATSLQASPSTTWAPALENHFHVCCLPVSIWVFHVRPLKIMLPCVIFDLK